MIYDPTDNPQTGDAPTNGDDSNGGNEAPAEETAE